VGARLAWREHQDRDVKALIRARFEASVEEARIGGILYDIGQLEARVVEQEAMLAEFGADPAAPLSAGVRRLLWGADASTAVARGPQPRIALEASAAAVARVDLTGLQASLDAACEAAYGVAERAAAASTLEGTLTASRALMAALEQIRDDEGIGARADPDEADVDSTLVDNPMASMHLD
jgi:hypothetical protein